MGVDRVLAEHQSLEANAVFRTAATELSALGLETGGPGSRSKLPLNLLACDRRGRLYVWNSTDKRLHYVDIKDSGPVSTSVDIPGLSASPHAKTVELSTPVTFTVRFLTLNRVGRSLALVGNGQLLVVDLVPYAPASASDAEVCRTTVVDVDRIFQSKNVHSLRILQVAWHPYSDTHLGVLSSDGVFRLFDLSIDPRRAEQEYHLQSGVPWKLDSSLARPVSFAFGGEHLWDRFTVFFAFSNGSIYCLCPVVPFGSLYNTTALEELARDAGQSSLLSDPTASGNATVARFWLESVFPGLGYSPGSDATRLGFTGRFMRKACSYVPLDSSVALQGPFTTVWSGDVLSERFEQSDEARQVVSLLYNTVGKDSILATCGLDGQIYLYALADEVQPTWNPGAAPRFEVDDDGHLLSVSMMAEALKEGTRRSTSIGTAEEAVSTVWTGQPPPLLLLNFVDLALSTEVLIAAAPALIADPVVPERLYCYHAGGIDAISLQWLPFSDQSRSGTSLVAAPPTVYPVLDAYSAGISAPVPLLGVAPYQDVHGETWMISATLGGLCVVAEVKACMGPTVFVDEFMEDDQHLKSLSPLTFVSKELLQGPKDIPIAQVAASGLKLTADSIEGRTILHDQCKLLREKYIEYAHKVHVELASHGDRLHEIISAQHEQLERVQEKVGVVFDNFDPLDWRIQRAREKNEELGLRAKKCSEHPVFTRRPLTVAERQLKDTLDRVAYQDLDVLRSALEELNVRSQHLAGRLQPRTSQSGGVVVPPSQMRRLKGAVDQLSSIVEDAAKKVKAVDESVKRQEKLLDRTRRH